MSWELKFKWIRTPTLRKSRDLNNAWAIKWKKAKIFRFILRKQSINPIWFKVERATIFFRSTSRREAKPLKSIEYKEIIKIVNLMTENLRFSKNRSKTTTPAVTRVEECTKAEMGVGAAIAIGSQKEKGYCALFVKQNKETHERSNKE